MKLKFGIAIAAIAAIAAIFAMPAMASHNRGSVLIPIIAADGTLTIEATSFWRKTSSDAVNSVDISFVPDGGGASQVVQNNFNMGADTIDNTDARYKRVDETAFTNISNFGAGVYTISWGSCCRVSGIPKAGSNSMGTTSTIFWDGSSATNPITFDINNIQPEVVR